MVDLDARQRLKLLVGGVSLLALQSCSGGGSSEGGMPAPTQPSSPTPTAYQPAYGLLRNTYRNNFKVGAAVRAAQINTSDPVIDILKSQYSSIVADYEMKPEVIAPIEGVYEFSAGDRIVQFAEDNGLEVHGHTLIWHHSTPDYFLKGSKEEIKARLQNYVTEVVTHFKGKVRAWHVVNEVVSDSDTLYSAPYENTNWYEATGSAEYIDWAFEAAHAADPDALLLMNEYSTHLLDKRTRVLKVVEDLLARNIPIHGVGHQCHLDYKDTASSVLAAIDAVDGLFAGLVNHVTEMDISVYHDEDTCWEYSIGCAPDLGDVIPNDILKTQAQILRDIFNGLTLRPSVEEVAFWGISDKTSWRNTTPVVRTDYPLLFDRDYKAKPAFRAITDRNYQI